MHVTHHDSGEGDTVHTTLAVEDAAPLRNDRPLCRFTITLGNVDLPAYVSHGSLYVEAPLSHIFKAFAEDLSDFVRDMEIGISDAGGAALSPAGVWATVFGKDVAVSHVVRGGR